MSAGVGVMHTGLGRGNRGLVNVRVCVSVALSAGARREVSKFLVPHPPPHRRRGGGGKATMFHIPNHTSTQLIAWAVLRLVARTQLVYYEGHPNIPGNPHKETAL